MSAPTLADAAQEVSNYLGGGADATQITGALYIVDGRYLFVFVADDGKLALLDFGDAEPLLAQIGKGSPSVTKKLTYQ